MRVYELAKEFEIESCVLIAMLVEMGEFVRSASSTVSPSVVSQVRDRLASKSDPAAPQRPLGSPPPRRFPPHVVPSFDDDLHDESQPAWGDLVTAKMAAMACGIRPSTIRQWVRRGYLRSSGEHKGRAHVYMMGDVVETLRMVNQRKPAPPRLRLPISSQDFETLITAKEAARLLDVAPSTIRMWITRGHLVPTSKTTRPRLFTVESVVRASRRPRPVNSRRPVGPWGR